jgi:hypothetical protein
MRAPFDWEDVEHWTGADLMETLLLLGTQDEAESFLSAYVDVCDSIDHALHNVKYLAQMILTDSDSDTAEDDALRVCVMMGIQIPEKDETISPRQWFSNSSLGIKVAA